MNYSTTLVQLPLVRETRGQKIISPEDAYRVCLDIATLAQESFHIMTLNTRMVLINRHLITLGLLDSTAITGRECFRPAILDGAAAVVLAHNHPSGNPSPSAEDLKTTRELIAAGKILGIRVADHIVVGRNQTGTFGETEIKPYVSIREAGLCTFA
jgi:DNA repair protein RadC